MNSNFDQKVKIEIMSSIRRSNFKISLLMIKKSYGLSLYICARLLFEFPQLIYDVTVIQILFL